MSPEMMAPPPEAAGHRPASVNLRTQGQTDDSGPVLDPANQSLAETLGLVFRVLQIFMIGLLGAFALSGFGQIKENESGVRLLFGRKTADRLEPGFRFSAPFPMGELVKVDRGSVPLSIDESFWPKLTEDQKGMALDKLAMLGKATLKPGDDGSLLTGDGNIAHAQWSVHYRRQDPGAYVQNILGDDEKSIVRAAVERGIVQAVAQVTIDDLLKQSAGDQGSIAKRAQEIAQGMLDQIESGIQIDQLTLAQIAPPFLVLNDFFGVQSAEQKASTNREEAQSAARSRLNEAAGAAHGAIIEQIDQYEQAVARNDTAAQNTIMQRLQAIFEGKEVKLGNQTVPAGAVSGKVINIMAEANQYRSTIVSQRESELDSFRAKLVQFKTTPNLVIQREWADAMISFLDHPYVEIFTLPPTAEAFELWLNRDPTIAKLAEMAEKERLMKLDKERRQAEQLEERFKLQTGGSMLRTR